MGIGNAGLGGRRDDKLLIFLLRLKASEEREATHKVLSSSSFVFSHRHAPPTAAPQVVVAVGSAESRLPGPPDTQKLCLTARRDQRQRLEVIEGLPALVLGGGL